MRASIFFRLMMGYIFLLVLATSVSVYSIVQLGRVRDVTQSITLEDNVLLDLHKSLSNAFLTETQNEKNFITLRDEAFYNSFLLAWRDFEKNLAQTKAVARSPELTALIERIGALHIGYQTLVDEEAALRKTGTPYVAFRYRMRKETAVTALTEALQTMRAMVQTAIIDKVTRLNEAVVQAGDITLAVTASSLVLGIIISLLITRSITVPLDHMTKKTAEIGSGIYGPALDLRSPPEIGALAQAFNFMSARLQNVDKMKSDFYALMSHELRTPLTSIKEGTNLFLEGHGGPVTEKQKWLLTIVAEESNRLIELVSSLMDLSKLEAGMLAYHFTKAELPPLVTMAAGEVLPLAEAKKIRIGTDIDAVPPVTLDPERIMQVLRNLIGNALKFTPPGGTVRLAVRSGEGGVGVSVTDSGPGIPKEHQTAIFDKYRQATLAGMKKIPGTGLGLAIVKHIIQDHGGTVWVESEEGQGSTFTFVLPF
ncbi:MAG: HAMP domain-containing histidine kinase [Nitrospirae bacterium]|nr:HAMP domain-containing histidine kinase [Nitrospirota bacterium]